MGRFAVGDVNGRRPAAVRDSTCCGVGSSQEAGFHLALEPRSSRVSKDDQWCKIGEKQSPDSTPHSRLVPSLTSSGRGHIDDSV